MENIQPNWPLVKPKEALWDSSRRCGELAKTLSEIHQVSTMPVQWEIERAVAALLTAKSRLSKAHFSLEEKEGAA